MTTARVELAALNNALWCDAVCRAHGVAGEMQPTVWLNRHVPPPYHSNLVVISSVPTQNEIDEHVRQLSACALSPTWSLKDSFANLEMAPSGFGVLFEAHWIWLDADVAAMNPADDATPCVRVTSPAELASWHACWQGDAANEQASATAAQFPDTLLHDAKIAFMACVEEEHGITAVGIAHRTPDVIGLCNVVIREGDRLAAWASLVGRARRLFPGLPIVGYERDDDLRLAQATGFQTIGELRVWVRQP